MKFIKSLSLLTGTFFFVNSFCQVQTAGITSIGSAIACPNTIITIPVNVLNCPLITGFNFSINYDATVLSALQVGNTGMFVSNVNSALAPVTLFFYAQSNKPGYSGIKQARIAWGNGSVGVQVDTNLNGIAHLFDIQFRYFGGTTTLTFDNSILGGGACTYIDTNSNEFIDTPSVNYYISGIVTECSPEIIYNLTEDEFSITNHPNPFSQLTTIDFNIHVSGFVTIDIFNIFGEHLLNITDKYFINGKYEEHIDMSKYSNGIYLYKVKYNINNKILLKTGILMKFHD